MRILHINGVYPPPLNIADGVTAAALNLTKGLVQKGHDVDVYASTALDYSGGRRLTESRSRIMHGAHVYHLNYLLKYHTFIITPTLIQLLRKTIDNYDIVHIHDFRSFQGIAAALASNNRVPYVIQPHGAYLSELPQFFVKRTLRRILDNTISRAILKRATRILALNESEASLLRSSLKIARERVKILPNGLEMKSNDRNDFKGQFRREFHIPLNKYIILYLGRIHFTKGIGLLLKAFTTLREDLDFKNVVLVLAGPNDGYMDNAMELCKILDISKHVIFTGFVEKEMKDMALADADLFVTPSFTGFPITFLEACAAGIPIITTTQGDILDWINGQVGHVVEPTRQALASSMNALLTNPNKRKRFSENCMKIVEDRFSLGKVVEALENLYFEAIESWRFNFR